jgi:hypothetical protein
MGTEKRDNRALDDRLFGVQIGFAIRTIKEALAERRQRKKARETQGKGKTPKSG